MSTASSSLLKVWTTLKGKPLQMVAHIISIDSPSNLKLAGSQDDIDAKVLHRVG